MHKRHVFCLAFSGSGFLAPLHAGAACAVMDTDCPIVETAGTSGGSIIAAAIATGMTQDELKRLAVDSSFKGLMNFGWFKVFKTRSYCDGSRLMGFLSDTFNDVQMKDLMLPCHIVATHFEGGKSFVFNQQNTPEVPVALACRASSAVPFIYAPIKYDGKTLVDGGVINNIPVSKLKLDGIRLGVDIDEASMYSAKSLVSFSLSLIGMLLSANEDSHEALARMTGAKILGVPAKEWFLDTDITIDQKQEMFQSGYDTMKSYLATTFHI